MIGRSVFNQLDAVEFRNVLCCMYLRFCVALLKSRGIPTTAQDLRARPVLLPDLSNVLKKETQTRDGSALGTAVLADCGAPNEPL